MLRFMKNKRINVYKVKKGKKMTVITKQIISIEKDTIIFIADGYAVEIEDARKE